MRTALFCRFLGKPLFERCRHKFYFSNTSSNEPSRFNRRYIRHVNSFKSPVTWTSLALTTIFAGGLWFYFQSEKENLEKSRIAKETMGTGRPKIGGPFTLTDHLGHETTDRDFLGKFLLIYFGFTFCPDVCPEELTKIAEIVDKLSKQSNMPIQPLFISIDPQRDSIDTIRRYITEFHPTFIGLTGTVEQISQVAKSYRVYFSAPSDLKDDGYIVDHSIITYLIDPKGEFLDYYGQQVSVEDATKSILKHMENFQKQVTVGEEK